MNRPDLFKSLDADLEEFLAFLAEAKQAWELEDMVRDLIPPFVGGGPADDEIIDAVVAKLSASPAGVSALHVMGLVAMPLVALRARGAVERIVEAGGPAPSSLARRCGGLKPVQAWCLTGKDEADSYLFLCHRPRVTRAQVGLVASGDFGDGPILIEGSLSAPVPESDVRSLIDDFEAEALHVRAIGLAEAGTAIAELAKRNIAAVRGPTVEAFPALVALLPYLDIDEWEGLVTALGQLPLAEPIDEQGEPGEWEIDDSEPLGDDEIAAIEKRLQATNERFESWIAGRSIDVEQRGQATFVARTMFDYRAWYRNGAPWDAAMLAESLLDYAPRKLGVDDDEIRSTPAAVAEVLEFLRDETDVTAPGQRRLLALVTRLTPEFVRAMSDPVNVGMAKRLVSEMERDGVALTDRDATRAWIDEFNERTFEERAELLPGPRFPLAGPPAAGHGGGRGDDVRRKRRSTRDARKRNRRR